MPTWLQPDLDLIPSTREGWLASALLYSLATLRSAATLAADEHLERSLHHGREAERRPPGTPDQERTEHGCAGESPVEGGRSKTRETAANLRGLFVPLNRRAEDGVCVNRAAPGPKLSACAPRRHSTVVKRSLEYHELLTDGRPIHSRPVQLSCTIEMSRRRS